MNPKRVMITDGEGTEWIRLDIFPDRELLWLYLVPPTEMNQVDELVDILTKDEALSLAAALTEGWGDG